MLLGSSLPIHIFFKSAPKNYFSKQYHPGQTGIGAKQPVTIIEANTVSLKV